MLCTSVHPLMNEPNNREAGGMGGIFNLSLVLHFSLPQVQYGSHGQRYTPVPRVTLISKTRRCRLRELSILVRIQEIMDEPAGVFAGLQTGDSRPDQRPDKWRGDNLCLSSVPCRSSGREDSWLVSGARSEKDQQSTSQFNTPRHLICIELSDEIQQFSATPDLQ